MVKRSQMLKPKSELENETYLKARWAEKKICSDDVPSLTQFLTNSITEHFFIDFESYNLCFLHPHFVLSGGVNIYLECRKCGICIACF
jgi:hypothetical protein